MENKPFVIPWENTDKPTATEENELFIFRCELVDDDKGISFRNPNVDLSVVFEKIEKNVPVIFCAYIPLGNGRIVTSTYSYANGMITLQGLVGYGDTTSILLLTLSKDETGNVKVDIKV